MGSTANSRSGSCGRGGPPRPPVMDRLASFFGVSRWTLARYGFCYVVLAIPSLLFLVFRIVPMAQTFQLSVFDWDLISPVKSFVGLRNFGMLLEDPNFRLAFSNTTVFAAVAVAASTVFALFVAMPLTHHVRMEGIYQLIYFLPYVAPVVPVAVAWKWIFDTRYGIVNYLLSLINVGPVPWLTRPDTVLWAVIIMSVRKMLGYNIVLFIVGLRAIPGDYNEAAQIDGATGWQLFRFITLPLLMPVVLLVTVFSTISAYNVFTQVYVLASDIQGSPGSLARVLIYDIFENAFRFYRMGYASAEASVFFVMVLVLTLFEFRVLRSQTEP